MAVPEMVALDPAMRGDTYAFGVVATYEATGAPLDLTGAKVWATFKTDLADDDGVLPGFQLSTTSSGVSITAPATSGTIVVTVPPSATASLEDTTLFFWDVQVRLSDGVTKTVARGTLTFLADVTLAMV